MAHLLHSLFHPQTLAVVGASDRAGSIGRAVYTQLCTQPALKTLLPVNPNHKTVGGHKAYATLAEAAQEHDIDCAVVVLSADKLGSILREAAKIRCRQIVFINSLDPVPTALRSKLERTAAQAAKAKINLLAVPAESLDGLFRQPENACAYIGQSSGIADCLTGYAQERGICFSRFVSLSPFGNTVSTGQFISCVLAEPSATALMVQVGVLDNPRELVSALNAAARHKPVIVLSTLPDEAQEELFLQALERRHILVARTLTQFFTAAKLIHAGIISRGRRISIISNTPQITALMLKNLGGTHLHLAELGTAYTRAVARMLGGKPVRHNPLCLLSDTVPSIFQAACAHALADEHTDAVFLIYAGRNTSDSYQVAQMAAALPKNLNKPLLLVWLGSADTPAVRQLFSQNKSLHFRQTEHALHALAQLNAYHSHLQKRYRTAPFHDYRAAADTARELHRHIRPLLPVAVLPAGKNNIAHLLAALHCRTAVDGETTSETALQLSWDRQEPFGQVLTLATGRKTLKLLPPVAPEHIARSLTKLGLPHAPWQNWLLDSAEVFSRLPEIHSLHLNLLCNTQQEIVCSDAKCNIQDPSGYSGSPNILAPYPHDAEQEIALPNRPNLYLRPVRNEDAVLIRQLIASLGEHSRYTRFISKAQELSPALLAQLSRPDYLCDFALLLHDAAHTPLAHAAFTADADGQSCEFGILIADSLQGQGIGVQLMNCLIARARAQGYHRIRAEILADNHPMQKLALKLGFTLSRHPDDNSLVEAVLDL